MEGPSAVYVGLGTLTLATLYLGARSAEIGAVVRRSQELLEAAKASVTDPNAPQGA